MPENPPGLFASPAWNECFVSFLQHIYDKSHCERSRHHYRIMLSQFFGDTGKPPDRVRRLDIERYLARPCESPRNRGGPPAPATRNSRLGVLSSFYHFASGYAVEGPDGTVAPIFAGYNPTANIAYVKAASTPHTLSESEIARLFAVMPTDTVIGLRDRAIFLMYFYTARRRSEIARLRYGDLAYGAIPNGDGTAHEGWTYRFTGKGQGGQTDSAELPQPAYDALHHYLVASGRLPTMTPASPLFIAIGPPRGGRSCDPHVPLHSSCIAWSLKRYARAAGIDPARVSIHKWRHASARMRYLSGQDIVSIQRLLRHTNLATTSLYIQSLTGTADPGAALLSARFAHILV